MTRAPLAQFDSASCFPTVSNKSRGIDSAVFLQAVVRPRAKLIKIPSGFGYTDHRYIKMSALHHRLQRRENLLVGQVTGCTEEDQSVGMRIAHTLLLALR